MSSSFSGCCVGAAVTLEWSSHIKYCQSGCVAVIHRQLDHFLSLPIEGKLYIPAVLSVHSWAFQIAIECIEQFVSYRIFPHYSFCCCCCCWRCCCWCHVSLLWALNQRRSYPLRWVPPMTYNFNVLELLPPLSEEDFFLRLLKIRWLFLAAWSFSCGWWTSFQGSWRALAYSLLMFWVDLFFIAAQSTWI